MPCWTMPGWMERYRLYLQTDGNGAEACMNDLRGGDRNALATSIKHQVALLIALREAGELAKVKPSAWA